MKYVVCNSHSRNQLKHFNPRISVLGLIYFCSYNKFLVEQGQEGYVVRVTSEIPYAHYRTKVGKMVRKNHVQTDDHWLNQELVPNKLLKQE